jgi:ABC-type phosphate transport system auxiliary subunit
MEPIDDDDLTPLLRRWDAPDTPDRLRARIFALPSPSRWRWLLTGSIRVPVPAVAALLLVMVWLGVNRFVTRVSDQHSGPQPVSLADFQPAAEMRVRVVGEWR